jgi:hypothetical protein
VLTALTLLTTWQKRTGPVGAEVRQKLARLITVRRQELADWSAEIRADTSGPVIVTVRRPNLRRVAERHLNNDDVSLELTQALKRRLHTDPHHPWPDSDAEAEALALLADSLPIQEWQSADLLARALVQWHGSRPVGRTRH